MILKGLKDSRSGQVLIVSALLLALILLSTAVYVIEIGKNAPEIKEENNSQFVTYKEAFRNALISALANVSNSGNSTVLTSDLLLLKNVILAHSYQEMLIIQYQICNTSPYTTGFWFSWDNNGHGVSSSCIDLTLNSSSLSQSSQLDSIIKVTSIIDYTGTYTALTNKSKQVNLLVNVLNDEMSALAKDFIVYYDFDGSPTTSDWLPVISPSIADFGNGKYSITFRVDTAQENSPVAVSLFCHDRRGILIGANVTCTLAH